MKDQALCVRKTDPDSWQNAPNRYPLRTRILKNINKRFLLLSLQILRTFAIFRINFETTPIPVWTGGCLENTGNTRIKKNWEPVMVCTKTIGTYSRKIRVISLCTYTGKIRVLLSDYVSVQSWCIASL